MDDGLKQRIIGAIVLLALAVVFIPVIFDKERIEPVDKKTRIPAAPHIETISIESTKKIPINEPAKKAAKIFIPDDQIIVDEKPEEPSINKKGVPNSWVLQIASFLHEKHALEFRDRLVTDGYAAFTRQVETDKGKMVRVFVGPKIDKNRLLAQQKQIEKKYELNTLFLKFFP